MNVVSAAVGTVAFVGNPNCGKTALFNALTGSRQKVANYPGVTVERKSGAFTLSDGRRIRAIDLPGIYSLRGRCSDERVTRDAILGFLHTEPVPEVLACVIDATNLLQGLRLVFELKRIGRPMIVVLNMIDIAERQGRKIDLDRLGAELGIPVVATAAVRKIGLDPLRLQLQRTLDAPRPANSVIDWTPMSIAEMRRAHQMATCLVKNCAKPPSRPDNWTGRLDAVLLHPVAGLIVLLAILLLIFQAVFSWAIPAMNLIDLAFSALSDIVSWVLPPGPVQSILRDGIIAGVGSVLIFLPQILILYLFILILEDCGYMARAAFLMDRIMSGVGLHGRAFIPLLSSFACAIPAIMSARVIGDRRDRLTVIMIAPLMTCSARIPVYTLLVSAFLPDRLVFGYLNLRGLVMFGLYAVGISSALAVSLIVRKVFWGGAGEMFVMELPTYKMPRPKNLAVGLLLRTKIFLRRAGIIILPTMILIWALSTYPLPPEDASLPAVDYTFAGRLGHFVAPAFAVIGFNWQMTISLIPGLAAREVAVAVLGTVYALANGEAGDDRLAAALAHNWPLASGLAFLAWYIFAPQCFATLGVVKRETNSVKWMVIVALYMTALAYLASFATYRIATFLGG